LTFPEVKAREQDQFLSLALIYGTLTTLPREPPVNSDFTGRQARTVVMSSRFADGFGLVGYG